MIGFIKSLLRVVGCICAGVLIYYLARVDSLWAILSLPMGIGLGLYIMYRYAMQHANYLGVGDMND